MFNTSNLVAHLNSNHINQYNEYEEKQANEQAAIVTVLLFIKSNYTLISDIYEY